MGGNTRYNHSSYRGTGGGGSGGTADGGIQKKLEQSEPNQKPEKVYHIFYFEGDRSKVALLQHQVKTSEAMNVKDVSLKEEVKSDNWKPEAKKHIAQSDQVIVDVGKNTAERKAVQWEIMEAMRQGKPIIAVRLNSDAKDPLPENVKEKDTVTWNLEDIQNEIDKNKRQKKRNKTRQAGEKQ